MKKTARVSRICRLADEQGEYVAKLTYWEQLELTERGYRYVAVEGGKYIVFEKEESNEN